MNYLTSATSGYSLKSLSLVLIVLLLYLCYGQKTFQLYSSVGDTIQFNEKLDYSLFTKSANGRFKFTAIQHINNNFVLIEARKLSLVNRPSTISQDTKILTQAAIIEEQKKIEKINAYYFNSAKQPKITKKLEAPKKKIPVRFSESSVEKRIIERMRFCSFDQSKFRSSLEYGLLPTEIQLDIKQ